MRIVHSLESVDKQELLEIYCDAFEGKYVSLLGNKDVVRRVLNNSYTGQNSICMLSDENELMGVLSYSENGKAMFNMSLSVFVKEFGVAKGLYRLFLLWFIFDRKTRKDECYIDHIVVSDNHRSKGVGKHLLDEMELVASSKKYKYIGLDVIDENPRALSLYKKIGFVVSKHQVVPQSISKRIGVSGVNSMLREVKEI